MFNAFQRLPELYQGIIYFMAGSILLLYALGIIEKGITVIVVLLAVCMIGVGFVKMGLYKKSVEALDQRKK